MRNAVSPLVGVLYRVRNYVPIKFLKQIYFSLIYSKFQYLISIWGSANLTKLKPLKKIQNKLIKCIYKLPHLEPTINLYKPKGFLNISSLYKSKVCNLIHSIKIKEKKGNIHLIPSDITHNYDTRQNSHFKKQIIKSNFGKRSLLYDGIAIYNDLPNKLKNIQKLNKFKIAVKKYFMAMRD